jgi:hypothetical protein
MSELIINTQDENGEPIEREMTAEETEQFLAGQKE